MSCPCGANTELAWRGNWDCTNEGDPDLENWTVYGEQRVKYNNRPTSERTFELYTSNGRIRNIGYDTIAMILPRAESMNIGDYSEVGELNVYRQSNLRPAKITLRPILRGKRFGRGFR